MITRSQLLHVFPNCGDPDTWAAAISEAWARFKIDSKNARSGFLGIIGNETGGLREVRRENLNYTPSRAKMLWPKARNNPHVLAERCAQGPEAFANWIYAGIIGNGDEASGDGWRFRGGGIIQLTGRANYRACGKGLGIDLENHPERITEPGVSALAAAWFVAKYVKILPGLESASEADFLDVSGKVGWVDEAGKRRRLEYRRLALEVVMPAGYVADDKGNVKREKIADSTIVKDSNKGAAIGTIAAGATAAGPVVQAIAGADWRVGIAFAAVAAIAIIGALYYFLRIRKRRKRMAEEGIA